jgi:type I restriction enzyme M protein
MLTAALKSKVDSLWDKFWSGGIANPLTAIEQISYLLFMRRLDAVDQKAKEDAEWLKRPYKSIFDGKYKHIDGKDYPKKALRWAEFRHLPGEDMLSFVRDHVFPFIKNLSGEDHPFSKYMKDAVFIVPKASLLVEAIGIIDEIYNEIERERQEKSQTFHDTQGDLYEYLLSEIATAGKNGQFRTPRHIIQMMCALVDPKLGEEICDPACGTGGFLLGAYQHILTQHTSKKLRSIDENGLERGLVGDKLTDDRQWKALKEKTFYGYDFDTTMVRIGLMNLITHGIDHPNLEYQDTLSKRFDIKDRFDVVLANPPFKGSIDKGDINEDLGLKTTKTELLFVNRIINLLRIGGRAAVIVPDGVLFGSSKAHVELRKMLVYGCELQGVVSMPSGVFRPYAGVSTAVIIFVRGGETKNVWFYDMQADGYSLDDKRDKTANTDLPDIIEKWKTRGSTDLENRCAKVFAVPVNEIREKGFDLSISKYKEEQRQHVTYAPPKEIIENLLCIEQEITKELNELRGLL